MHLDPVLGPAVAGLAADAIGELELRPAARRRHVVGVAVEADVGGVRRLQPEVAGDPLRLLVEQQVVGVGVLVARLPGGVLVLQHHAALRRRRRAVAGGARAGGDAEVHGLSCCGTARQLLAPDPSPRSRASPRQAPRSAAVGHQRPSSGASLRRAASPPPPRPDAARMANGTAAHLALSRRGAGTRAAQPAPTCGRGRDRRARRAARPDSRRWFPRSAAASGRAASR